LTVLAFGLALGWLVSEITGRLFFKMRYPTNPEDAARGCRWRCQRPRVGLSTPRLPEWLSATPEDIEKAPAVRDLVGSSGQLLGQQAVFHGNPHCLRFAVPVREPLKLPDAGRADNEVPADAVFLATSHICPLECVVCEKKYTHMPAGGQPRSGKVAALLAVAKPPYKMETPSRRTNAGGRLSLIPEDELRLRMRSW